MGSGGGIGWRIMHCGVWQHIGVVGNLRLAEVVDKFTDLEKREVGLWGKLTHLDSRRLIAEGGDGLSRPRHRVDEVGGRGQVYGWAVGVQGIQIHRGSCGWWY